RELRLGRRQRDGPARRDGGDLPWRRRGGRSRRGPRGGLPARGGGAGGAGDGDVSEERIQKILARAGVASRRKAEELIEQGLVTVNGRVAGLGDKADPERDAIKVD